MPFINELHNISVNPDAMLAILHHAGYVKR
jgi:hypothetical protein